MIPQGIERVAAVAEDGTSWLKIVILKAGIGVLVFLTALFGVRADPTKGAFPSRELQLVVPAEPGGGIDLMARIVAKGLSTDFSQPVVVLNRSGASGNIGTASVAGALPDGYTLLNQLKDPAVVRQLRGMGVEPDSMGRAEFSSFLVHEMPRLETLVKRERRRGCAEMRPFTSANEYSG